MPNTQTIQFGYPTGATISVKLFADGSDTIVDTQSATEQTNRLGIYKVDFTDNSAGAYLFIGFVNSIPVISGYVDLTETTATFLPRGEVAPESNATNISAIKTVTDKINNTLEDDGGTYRFTTNALEQAPSSAGGVSGSGAISTTLTIDDGGAPLDGVEVWISSDASGSNVVAGTLSTDALGQVTFMLDAGTYYVWKQKAGYNPTNPQTITVSS